MNNIHNRTRKIIKRRSKMKRGTPRLLLHITNRHHYIYLYNGGLCLLSCNDVADHNKSKHIPLQNRAKMFSQKATQLLAEHNIKEAVLDIRYYTYIGRVATIVDILRNNIQFI